MDFCQNGDQYVIFNALSNGAIGIKIRPSSNAVISDQVFQIFLMKKKNLLKFFESLKNLFLKKF
jgi:hypothetical protein